MNPQEKVQETLKEVDQIGGVPSDQEFYNEFDSRLRRKLDLGENDKELWTVRDLVWGLCFASIAISLMTIFYDSLVEGKSFTHIIVLISYVGVSAFLIGIAGNKIVGHFY